MRSTTSLPDADTPLKESASDDEEKHASLSRLDKLRAKHNAIRKTSGVELLKSKQRLAHSSTLNWYSQDFNKSGRKFFVDEQDEESSDNDTVPVVRKVPLHVALKKENDKLRQRLEKTESERQVLRRKLSKGGMQNLSTEKAILATKLREANARYSNLELELNETKEALSAKDMTTAELLDEMHTMRERYDSLSEQLKSRQSSTALETKEKSGLPELQTKIADLENRNKELLLEKMNSRRDLGDSDSDSGTSTGVGKLSRVQESNLTMYRTKLSISSAELTRAEMEVINTVEELRQCQLALEEAHSQIERLRREKRVLQAKVETAENRSRNLRILEAESTDEEEQRCAVQLLIDDSDESDIHSSDGDDHLDYDLASVDPDDTSLPDGADFEDNGTHANDEDVDGERFEFLKMKQVIFTQAIRSLSSHDVNLLNQASMLFTALLLLCGYPLLAFFFSALGIVVYLLQKDKTLSLQKDSRKFFLVNCASSLAALFSWMLMARALSDLERPLKFAFATLMRETAGIALAGFLFYEYRSVESEPETALDIIEVKVNILEGRGLVAKDKNLFGRSTTSDPYVKIFHANNYIGKTAIVWKTLNPMWKNQRFCIAAIPNVLDSYDMIECNIYDHDTLSTDDSMGTVLIPIPRRFHEKVRMWYPVEKGKGGDYCRNATGDLHVEVEVQPRLSNSFKNQLQRMSSIKDLTRATFRRSYQDVGSPVLGSRENGKRATSMGFVPSNDQISQTSKPIASEAEAAVIRI